MLTAAQLMPRHHSLNFDTALLMTSPTLQYDDEPLGQPRIIMVIQNSHFPRRNFGDQTILTMCILGFYCEVVISLGTLKHYDY